MHGQSCRLKDNILFIILLELTSYDENHDFLVKVEKATVS